MKQILYDMGIFCVESSLFINLLVKIRFWLSPVPVIMGTNILLVYFMFQAIWNSFEGYFFLLDKFIILVEWGRPSLPPPMENSLKIIIFFLTPSLTS